MEERIIDGEISEFDERFEQSLRPQRLSQYIGQQKVKHNLEIFIEAAKMRSESLDHVLLYGPPGLGKTTKHFLLMYTIKKSSGRKINDFASAARFIFLSFTIALRFVRVIGTECFHAAAECREFLERTAHHRRIFIFQHIRNKEIIAESGFEWP